MFFLAIWNKSCVFIINIQCPNHFSIRLFCHLPITWIKLFPMSLCKFIILTIRCRMKFHFQTKRGEKQLPKFPMLIVVTAVYVLMYYAYSFWWIFSQLITNCLVLFSLIQSNSCFEDIDKNSFWSMSVNCLSILLCAE